MVEEDQRRIIKKRRKKQGRKGREIGRMEDKSEQERQTERDEGGG